MPFAVSQWPYNPDPRLPAFDQVGWEHSQVPPWIWTLKTTNATGPYAILNSGVSVEPFVFVVGTTRWRRNPAAPVGLDIVLSIIGTVPPSGVPPRTKTFDLDIFETGTTDGFIGQLLKTFPTAIAEHAPLVMVSTGSPTGTIPDPIKLVPTKWNVEIP